MRMPKRAKMRSMRRKRGIMAQIPVTEKRRATALQRVSRRSDVAE
jgi:hypothetical protein